MTEDEEKTHSEVVKRVVKVAAVFGFFLLVLLGFYAEIAMTSIVCAMLGLGDASALLHAAAFVAYVATVAVSVAYATGELQ